MQVQIRKPGVSTEVEASKVGARSPTAGRWDLALLREPIGSPVGSRNLNLKIHLNSRDGGI